MWCGRQAQVSASQRHTPEKKTTKKQQIKKNGHDAIGISEIGSDDVVLQV